MRLWLQSKIMLDRLVGWFILGDVLYRALGMGSAYADWPLKAMGCDINARAGDWIRYTPCGIIPRRLHLAIIAHLVEQPACNRMDGVRFLVVARSLSVWTGTTGRALAAWQPGNSGTIV